MDDGEPQRRYWLTTWPIGAVALVGAIGTLGYAWNGQEVPLSSVLALVGGMAGWSLSIAVRFLIEEVKATNRLLGEAINPTSEG